MIAVVLAGGSAGCRSAVEEAGARGPAGAAGQDGTEGEHAEGGETPVASDAGGGSGNTTGSATGDGTANGGSGAGSNGGGEAANGAGTNGGTTDDGGAAGGAGDDDDGDDDGSATNGPGGVSAASGPAVVLTWNAYATADSYNIYRGAAPGFTLASPIATTTAPTYSDTTAPVGVTVYYKVTAVTPEGETPAISEVSATRIDAPGSARLLTAKTAEDGRVSLSWLAPTGGGAIAAYKIYRGTTATVATTGTPHAEVEAPDLSFADTAVSNGTTYFYRIVAANAAGDAAASNEADAKPWSATAPASAAMVFVHGEAGANGDGSRAAPFNNLKDAFAYVAAGGTVVILDGTVDVAGLTPATDQTIATAATIRSETGHHRNGGAIITDSSAGVDRSGLVIAASDVTVKGLRFTSINTRNSPQGAIQIADLAIADVAVLDNAITNCSSRGISKNGTQTPTGLRIAGNHIANLFYGGGNSGHYPDGIRVYKASGVVIEDNEITDIEYDGIIISDVLDLTIRRNVIERGVNTGVQIGPNSGPVVITDNRIAESNTGDLAGYGGLRIYGNQLVGSLEIKRNVFADNFNGLVIRNGEDITGKTIVVRDNSFLGNSNAGVTHTGAGALDVSGNWWGAAAGPKYGGAPADGGDAVYDNNTGNVTYAPALTSAP